MIYEGAVSTLAQIIGQSENNTVEQNGVVLDTIADYSSDLATFVASSSVVINDTVSITMSSKRLLTRKHA